MRKERDVAAARPRNDLLVDGINVCTQINKYIYMYIFDIFNTCDGEGAQMCLTSQFDVG